MTVKKLILRNENEIRFLYTDSLLAIKVDNYLCKFFMKDGDDFICTKTLKEVALLLPDYFVRINRSCIINAKQVKAVNIKRKFVILSLDLTFEFSVPNLKTLKQVLGLKQ